MIYFDNSATTPPCEAAIEAADAALRETWGNPSSAHAAGVAARRVLESARSSVASSIGVRRLTDAKMVFTSGGTEANNLAITGSVYSKERPVKGGTRGTVIISDGEHASVEASAHRLEGDGFKIYRIPTKGGALDLDDLEKNAEGVIFASVMKVNNETGAIQPQAFSMEATRSLLWTMPPPSRMPSTLPSSTVAIEPMYLLIW